MEKNKVTKEKRIVSPHLVFSEYVSLYNSVLSSIEYENNKGYRRFSYNNNNTVDNESIKRIIRNHLVHDLYMLHNVSDDEIKLNAAINPVKTRFLAKIVNPNLKIITKDNGTSSYFFTVELSKFIVDLFTKRLDMDLEQTKALLNALTDDDEESEHNDQTAMLEKIVDEIFQDDVVKNDLSKAQDKASDKSGDSSDTYSPSDGWDLSSGKFEKIKEYNKALDYIKSIKTASVDPSLFNFVSKYATSFMFDPSEVKLETFDNADDYVGFADPYYFAIPELRMLALQSDVITYGNKPKLDLYLDASGSMGNTLSSYSAMAECKAVALKLYNSGIVNNIYFFTTELYGPFDSAQDIIMYDDSGGTDFNVVARSVIETSMPSICITDGSCSIDEYTEDLMWIFIKAGEHPDLEWMKNSNEGQTYFDKSQCYNHHEGTMTKL